MKFKKTAIIFGISGQDGAYLSHLLLEKGYKVIGTTRNKSSKNLHRLERLNITKKIILLKGEATNLKFCEKILGRNINEIYYLAGDSSVINSFETPHLSLKSNTEGILNILKTLKQKEKELSEQIIPSKLEEFGVLDIKLADGSRISAEPFYAARITAEKTDDAHQWLRDNGHGDIIKNVVSVSFGRGEDDRAKKVMTELFEQGLDAEQKESVHKLFIHPENKLPIYRRELGSGTIHFNDTLIHDVKIEVSDVSGNTSTLNFNIVSSNNPMDIQYDSLNLREKNEKLMIENDNYFVQVDSNTFYDDFIIDDQFKNKMLSLKNKNLPQKKKFIIAMKFNKHEFDDPSKIIIAHHSKKGKVLNRKGEVSGDWITTNVSHLGDFTLMIDSTAPVIKTKRVNEMMTLNQSLQFLVTDNLSGVEKYKVKIDGKWIYSTYNYKNAVLTIPLDAYANLEAGEKICEIEVEDESKNKKFLTYNFLYK